MEDKLLDLLSSENAKQSRSRSEPYGEFVEALRRQSFTCRDITALLAEKCQFETRGRSAGCAGTSKKAEERCPSEFTIGDDEHDHLYPENDAIQPGTRFT